MSIVDTWWLVAKVDGASARQVADAVAASWRDTPAPVSVEARLVRDLVEAVASGKALFPGYPSVLLWGCETKWGIVECFLHEAASFLQALWADGDAISDFESIVVFAQTEYSRAQVWECHPTGAACVQDTQGDHPLQMFWLWREGPLDSVPLMSYEDLGRQFRQDPYDLRGGGGRRAAHERQPGASE